MKIMATVPKVREKASPPTPHHTTWLRAHLHFVFARSRLYNPFAQAHTHIFPIQHQSTVTFL